MRLAAILIICVLAVVALAACSKAGSPSPEAPAPSNASKLCSVYYAHSHMDRYSSFRFELYEQDSKVYFSGSCRGIEGEKAYEYEAEQVAVPGQELQNAQVILDKHNTKQFLKTYRRPLNTFLDVQDAPTTAFSARWSDTKSMDAKSAGDAGEELEVFFRQLAAKYGKSKL